MKISKSLKVINVSEPVVDKNGIAYKQIGVATASEIMVFNEVGQPVIVKVIPKKGTFNAWEHSYPAMLNLARKKGVDFSELTKEDLRGVSPDFSYNFRVGDKTLGDVVSHKVEPYSVPTTDGEERIVDTYSCVVLGNTADESEFEGEVKRTFQRNGRKFPSNGTLPMFRIPTEQEVSEEVEKTF